MRNKQLSKNIHNQYDAPDFEEIPELRNLDGLGLKDFEVEFLKVSKYRMKNKYAKRNIDPVYFEDA